MSNTDKQNAQAAAKPAAPEAQRVKWSTKDLKSSYCNVCSANSTREEVVLNFGMNSNWDRPHSELEIDLVHRVIMSPFAAKRLTEVLSKLMKEYEARYGELG